MLQNNFFFLSNFGLADIGPIRAYKLNQDIKMEEGVPNILEPSHSFVA